MKFFVYILYSRKLKRFYCGYTSNLEKRIHQHNNYESPYTSQGTPWILIWASTKANIVEAKSLEKKIKNLSQARKLNFIERYSKNIINPTLVSMLMGRMIGK